MTTVFEPREAVIAAVDVPIALTVAAMSTQMFTLPWTQTRLLFGQVLAASHAGLC